MSGLRTGDAARRRIRNAPSFSKTSLQQSMNLDCVVVMRFGHASWELTNFGPDFVIVVDEILFYEKASDLRLLSIGILIGPTRVPCTNLVQKRQHDPEIDPFRTRPCVPVTEPLHATQFCRLQRSALLVRERPIEHAEPSTHAVRLRHLRDHGGTRRERNGEE